MLFSEPKIPQRWRGFRRVSATSVSVLFSEPKIPQADFAALFAVVGVFQCSSASRKFLKGQNPRAPCIRRKVSVLFSEPKIPQPNSANPSTSIDTRFSALQRAENSSTEGAPAPAFPDRQFQCSSASRKFLNSISPLSARARASASFSALQRAENSSTYLS